MKANPVNIIRDSVENQLGKGQKEKNGPTIEEVEREEERLKALHVGWLEHPITQILIKKVEKDYEEVRDRAYKKACSSNPENNNFTVEAAIYHNILRFLTTKLPYASP